MPGVTQYTLKDDKANEDAFRAEMQARGTVIERNWKYYDGIHDQPLKAQKDGYNDNVIVNNIEPLADRSVALLLGDGIEFNANGDNAQTVDDDNIELLWQSNRGEILLNDIALGGSIEGHCALRLEPTDGWPKLVRIRQQHFTAFWDALDMSRVLWYRLQYSGGGIGRRIDYVRGRYSDGEFDHSQDGWIEVVFEQKEQTTGTAFGGNDKWVMIGEPTPWAYDSPPIIDWPNISNPNGYYGKSDVKGAIHLNDALNFILSNMQRIIKHYASPKTVGIGFKANDIVGTEAGGLYTVNKSSSEAKIYNLEMQSDLKSSMELAGIITAGLWQSGGMVDPQTLKDRIGALTNFGLRVLYTDAIKRTDKKRALYEEGLSLASLSALAMVGLSLPQSIEIIWPDVLPSDDKTLVDALTVELTNGIISKETYRQMRGYDNERELDRLAEEAQGGNVGANILQLLTTNQPFNQGG